jgi:phosphopantetheinyl transferase
VFLRCWTAGEALGKATGLGIAGFGGKFPITLDSADEPCIAQSWQTKTAARWQPIALDFGARYLATLVCQAVADSYPRIELFTEGRLCHATGIQ